MKYIRVLAILSAILVTASFASAQRISVGVGVGPAYGYYGPEYYGGGPVCAYGYYSYAPYACAPYGYYGPAWFSDGIFIGAGPWYNGYFYGRPGFRAFLGRGGGFRGGEGFHGGGGFRGGEGFHGGGGFHGEGGNFHGGGGGFHGSGGSVHGGGGFHGGGGSHGGHR